jgi:hypothetical protein
MIALGADLTVIKAPLELAGDLALSPVIAASLLGVTTELAGDLAPSVSFVADTANLLALAGPLTPTVTLAADITVDLKPVIYVDLQGNLGGGASLYGMGAYGVKHYSRADPSAAPFSPRFNGDLSGSFAFGTADLAPQVTFAGDLSLTVSLAGDIPPAVNFAGEITFDIVVQGDLPFTVVFAGGELTAGPLWAETDPCPVTPWEDVEPCPTPPWVDAAPCPVSSWGSTAPTPPTIWTPVDPCDAEWEESELCNG